MNSVHSNFSTTLSLAIESKNTLKKGFVEKIRIRMSYSEI